MKRCPQCDTIYSDETQFCLHDGAVLIDEIAADDDEETIIRHHSITVDIPAAPTNYQTFPIANQPTIIVEKQRNTGKYLLFLIVGLLLGSGLVLATLLVARSINQDETANVKTNNKNQTERVTVSNQPLNSQMNAVENINSQINANLALNNSNTLESNKVHEEKTVAADEDFNGRVITLNAYLRAAPSKTASEISILPKDDRLKIGERENPNSPWYRVTCEHGESGWMHGDTIEFTR